MNNKEDVLDENIKLKKFDFIKIGAYKYLIYKISSKSAELLPINAMLRLSKPVDVVPKIKVSRDSLNKCEVLSSDYFYYLINQTNPLIFEALEDFLDENKSRED